MLKASIWNPVFLLRNINQKNQNVAAASFLYSH